MSMRIVSLLLLLCYVEASSRRRTIASFSPSPPPSYTPAYTPSYTPQYTPQAGSYGGYHGSTIVRTSTRSAGGTISDAFWTSVFGWVMIVFAFPVLWSNERRQAKMWALFERATEILKQNVSADKIDSENECCLVHVPGTTKCDEELVDADCNIKVRNCARLERSVEMYQWVETSQSEERDNMMGGKETITTYNYYKDWRSSYVDSNCFQDKSYYNPSFKVAGKTTNARTVTLGAFTLPDGLICQMSNLVPLAASELPAQLVVSGFGSLRREDDHYTSQQPGQIANVGDIRVSFRKLPCGDVTVMAVQRGDTFVPFAGTDEVSGSRVLVQQTEPLLNISAPKDEKIDLSKLEQGSSCGCCTACSMLSEAIESVQIFQLTESKASAMDMFQAMNGSQNCCQLCLRILGFCLLFFGWDCVLSFVPALFRIIPLIGTWIQAFGNMLATITSLILATVLWCITVAVAWLSMRPMRAMALLVVAGLLIAIPTIISHSSTTSG